MVVWWGWWCDWCWCCCELNFFFQDKHSSLDEIASLMSITSSMLNQNWSTLSGLEIHLFISYNFTIFINSYMYIFNNYSVPFS